MPLLIINYVGKSLLGQQPGFFWHELQRNAEENILLRDLGKRANEDTEDTMRSAKPGDGVDVVEHVSLDGGREAEDGEGECGWGYG